MSDLDLTPLFHDGPVARAYLAAFAGAGRHPRALIHLLPNRHPASGRSIAPWLPARLRRHALIRVHDSAMNHWPRRLRRSHPALVARIRDRIVTALGIDGAAFDHAYGGHSRLAGAAQHQAVPVNGFDDPALQTALDRAGNAAVLFSGGGIVPGAVLDASDRPWLHIHPAVLPRTRGADCLLWSILLDGAPGASLFRMAAGIDRGDLIAGRRQPPLAIPIGAVERPDDATLYRLAFAFIDPWVRAALLLELLAAGLDPATAPAAPQAAADGLTHHFMHPKLRALALARLFPAADRDAGA